MINKEMFLNRKDKIVNVTLDGSGGTFPGTVVDCSDRFLTLSTKWSSRQYISLEKIIAFWCNEDGPID